MSRGDPSYVREYVLILRMFWLIGKMQSIKVRLENLHVFIKPSIVSNNRKLLNVYNKY